MSTRYTAPPPPRRKTVSLQQQQDYDALAEQIEQEEGLQPGLLRALISQESGYEPTAESPKGARGLGQLMPATAARFGVVNRDDPEQNLRGSAKYLKFLHDRYKGDLDKVYAGYNAGEGAVDKYGGIPPYKETQDYVPKVRSNYARITGDSSYVATPASSKPSRNSAPTQQAMTWDDLVNGTQPQQQAQQEPAQQSQSSFTWDDLVAGKTPPTQSQQPQQQAQAQQQTGIPAPNKPRIEGGVKIFDPKASRSDVLAKQFGMSQPEIDAFKAKYKRGPFDDYQGTIGLPEEVKAKDWGRFQQLSVFLGDQRKAAKQALDAGVKDPNSIVENLVVPDSGQAQRTIGATAGSFANAGTFGNLNRIQKVVTGADIPEPERLRTKVVNVGTEKQPKYEEIYDDEANPEGSPLREIFSPENAAGLAGNLTGFTGLSKGLAAAGGKLAGVATQGSKLAKVGQVLAGTAPNVTRLQNAGKTAALFGTAGALANPNPDGKMGIGEEIAARIKEGVASGATGYISGVLAGVTPRVATEMLTFTVPQATKTALQGYLAGMSYEEIEKAVAKEATTNVLLPFFLRLPEIGRKPSTAAKQFEEQTRAAARQAIGEVQEQQALLDTAAAKPPIGQEAPGLARPIQPTQLDINPEGIRAEDLDTRIAELNKQLEKEITTSQLLADDTELDAANNRIAAMAEDLERLQTQRRALPDPEPVAQPTIPIQAPIEQVETKVTDPNFDEFGNTRSASEVGRIQLERLAKGQKLAPEGTKQLTDLQRQFTSDPITGFEIDQNIQPTLDAAKRSSKESSYAKIEVVNVAAANNAYANPLAANDVIGKYADILREELSPLNKLGGKVNLFRGKGPQFEVVASGVSKDLLNEALIRAKARIDKEVVKPLGLDRLASPKLKKAKPEEYQSTLGKSGSGIEYGIESIDTRSSSAIRESASNAIENNYVTRAGSVDAKAFQEGYKPERPKRQREPEYLTRKVRPIDIENGEDFATPQELLRKDFDDITKNLTPQQRKLLKSKVDNLLLKDELLKDLGENKQYSFLGASEREFTAKRAIEYTDQTGIPSFYAEFDFRNVGGLNNLGRSIADAHLKKFAEIIAKNLDSKYLDQAKVSLFRHGGDEVSAIIVGADQKTIQLALDKSRLEVDKYVREQKLQDLVHPKGSLPGTGIVDGLAEFKPFDQNNPLSMRDRVEDALGKAGKDVEDKKEVLKKKYQETEAAKANKQEVTTDGQRGKVSETGVTTPTGRSGSTKASTKGRDRQVRSGASTSESKQPAVSEGQSGDSTKTEETPSTPSSETQDSSRASGAGKAALVEEKAPVKNKPAWLEETLDQYAARAEKAGLGDKIEELAAEGLTADQIRQRIKPEIDKLVGMDSNNDPNESNSYIRAVRYKRNIPSLNDKQEFADWVKKYNEKKHPTQAKPNVEAIAKATGVSPEKAQKIVDNLAAKRAEEAKTETKVETPVETKVEETKTPATQNEIKEAIPGTRKLIDDILSRLKNNKAISTPTELYKIANEALKGKASADYAFQDAYNALEGAVNKYLLEKLPTLENRTPEEKLAEMRKIMELLPTQYDRSGEKVKQQAFSTPPPLAFLANEAARIKSGDVVLEPSAGTGGLAVFAKAKGADVYVNEIDPKRIDVLKAVGLDKTSSLDASQIDDRLASTIQPDVVVMNPPFSSNIKAGKDLLTGANHVESALKRLKDNGRLVAIVGGGMKLDSKAYKPFFDKVLGKYNLVANLGIEGKEYKKYGTDFDNRLLVFDKTGATDRSKIITGDNLTLDQALEKIGGLNDRATTATTNIQSASSKTSVGQPSGDIRSSAGRELPVSGVSDKYVANERGERAGMVSPESTTDKTRVTSKPSTDISREQPTDQPVITGDGESTRSSGSTGEPNIRPELETKESKPPSQPVKEEINPNEEYGAFVRYKAPFESVSPHQGDIVETKSMAGVSAPPLDPSNVGLPKQIVDTWKQGKISDLQMESVARTHLRHNQTLGDGSTAGFFIGDGTGVGKGRQIAAIAHNNWLQGRRKIVWVSVNGDLLPSAARDLKDIGADIPLTMLSDIKPGQTIADNFKEGIIFAGYKGLTSEQKGNKGQTRLKQLGAWLGEDPLIVFDEVHKAKNFIMDEGTFGSGNASLTAQAVDALHKQLPKGRMVYVSATGASEVRHLGIMSRLGLWGSGTQFPNGFAEFETAIRDGGLGAMEMVAQDMKALGMYTSRSISFKGTEFTETIHDLTPEQKKMYDLGAQAWRLVMDNMQTALGETKSDGRARANAVSNFWSSHQRFFNTLITAMKVPTLVKEVDAAIKRGESVVVSLVNTGEAQAEREASRIKDQGLSYDEMDFSPRQAILNYLDNAFPTKLYEEIETPEGKKQLVAVVDADGKAVESQEAVRIREKAKEITDKMFSGDFALPDNPIDTILKHFGHENVAELTKRSKQYITDPLTGEIAPRSRPKSIGEMEAFQAGTKKIAIISDAASTGISLHASNENPAEGQRRRSHIVLQLGWSADKQMQSFGRTHRTNQANAPRYTLLSTNIGGEKRFSSTIARRLADMGALTKGERQATGSDELSKYNFETPEGETAVEKTYKQLYQGTLGTNVKEGMEALRQMGLLEVKEGVTKVREDKLKDVRTFLNRVLALEQDKQTFVFDRFMQNFEQTVSSAKEKGTFDAGAKDIKAEKLSIGQPTVITKDKLTGAETKHYKLDADLKNDILSLDNLYRRVTTDIKPEDGFYKQTGGKQALVYAKELRPITDATGNVTRRFELYTPERGRVAKLLDLQDLKAKYSKVEENGDKEWEQRYTTAPKTRQEDIHIISGALLPLWRKLTHAVSKVVSKDEGLQITRVADTTTGERVVGVKIPNKAVDTVLKTIGVAQEAKQLAPEQVFDKVYDGGETIALEGGLELKQVRRAGNDVVEIKNTRGYFPYNETRRLQQLGIQSERVGYDERFYLPTDREKATTILTKLLADNPVKPPEIDIAQAEANPEVKSKALTVAQIPKAMRPVSELANKADIWQGNALEDGQYISDGNLLLDKTVIDGQQVEGLLTANEKKTGVKQDRAKQLLDDAAGNNRPEAEIIGFYKEGDSNKALIVDKAYDKNHRFFVDGDKLKLMQDTVKPDKYTYVAGYDSGQLVGYKDGKPVGLLMGLKDTNKLADRIAIDKVRKAISAPKKGKLTLYQENIDPETLVAPGGISRRKLWNVIATHGLVDADGKKLSFKQAIDQTDKVLYLMDTFARSTGKDVDAWYKETFAGAQSMIKPNGKVDAKGATEFLKNGQAVLKLFQGADASTLVHESFHIFRRQLTAAENTTLNKWLASNGFKDVDLNNASKTFTNAEEFIARAGENYLRSGKLPEQAPSMLKQVFDSFGSWITSIYDRLQANGKIPIPISGKIKKFFNEVQFDEQARDVFEQRFIRGSQSANQQPQELARPINTAIATKDSNIPRNTPQGANQYSLDGTGEIKTRSVPESARSYLDPELAKQVPEQQYNTLSNSETAQAASKLISLKPDDALAMATGDKSGALENEVAIQMLKQSQEQGDFRQARQIIDALARRATESGRAIQILSRISNVSPEGIVRYAERLIEKESRDVPATVKRQAEIVSDQLTEIINALGETSPVKEAVIRFFQKTILPKQLKDKVLDAVTKAKTKQEQIDAINLLVKKHYKIPILDNTTAEKLYNMAKTAQGQTGYEQDLTNARIAQLIGQQVQATTGKKLNFLLRAVDLFNPGGGLFNTAADTIYGGIVETGVDYMASGLDRLGKATGVFKQRSFVAPKLGEQVKEYKTNLGRVKNEILEGIDTNETLEKKMGLPSSVPIKGKVASFVDKSIRFGYGWTQSAGFRTAKAESIKSQMRAAELNGQKLTAPTDAIIERAELEAAKRAMIDDNFVSNALSGIRKSLNRLSTGGASQDFGLGSILLTYTQVPGSLLKRGFEFSPAGFGKVGYEIFNAVAKGELNQRELVQSLSRALIGTGVTLATAALLAKTGILQQPSEGEDEGRLRRLESDEGFNTYRLNVDSFLRYAQSGFKDLNAAKPQQNDRLLNYEFMQPLGFLFNLGANLDRRQKEAIKAEKEGKPQSGAWNAIKAITESGIATINDVPLVRSLVEAAQITENDKNSGYLTNLAKKLVTRPIPAVVRQARTYLDNTKRVIDEPGDLETTILNSLKDSTPGLSSSLPPQKTAFGDDKERITGGGGFVDSFISTSKVNKYQTSEESDMAKRIFEQRPKGKERDYHIPSAPREVKVNDVIKTLTAQEKSDYQGYLGQKTKEIYRFAAKSEVFNSLDAEKQGKVLQKYLDIVKDKAKIEVLGDNPTKKDKILARPVLPSKDVFEHNLKVDVKVMDLLDKLETNKEWKKQYEALNLVQQAHVERQINNLFNKARIAEVSDQPEMVQKIEANQARLIFSVLKPEVQIPVLLNVARFYQEE